MMSPKKKHKKKHRKDESSDIYNEDKRFKNKNFKDTQQVEFVYYNPTIIQDVDLFQTTVKDSYDSLEDDSVEDVDFGVKEEPESEELSDSFSTNNYNTDSQVTVPLKMSIQLANSFVINISIDDIDVGNRITRDLLQYFGSEQNEFQKICNENSKDINITTTDTITEAAIQNMLKVLLTLFGKFDI